MRIVSGWEGHLAATSVTPRIARVDSSADLAGSAGVPFLPHGSMCDPPKAARSVEEDNHPSPRGEERSSVKGIQAAVLPC